MVCSLPLFLLIGGIWWLTDSKKQEEPKLPMAENFEVLMGKELPSWQFVQTKEDWENLSFFQTLFEKNKIFLDAAAAQTRIPKVIHFIWIGPNPFPRESVENVKSWIAQHPNWTVKFWTDRNRPLPHPEMQLQLLSDFKFIMLEDCFHDSDNYAEKADVWRYEILFQEGGVYVDHDVKCIKSFDSLNSAYDLYCGLELPSQTTLSSSVHVTNNLIGVVARHPILHYCLDWLKNNWNLIGKLYPGKEREAVIDRVSHRTFAAFLDGVRQKINTSHRDIVFPAYYFNAPKDELAIFARHLYAGTWFENETKFEKMARQRLMLLSKKVNKILLFCGVTTGMNFLGFLFLAFQFRKLKKQMA
jgi:hypothetical protein